MFSLHKFGDNKSSLFIAESVANITTTVLCSKNNNRVKVLIKKHYSNG